MGELWDDKVIADRERVTRTCDVCGKEGGHYFDCARNTQSKQPDPQANASEPVIPQLQRALQRRMDYGVAKYGVPLQAGNGRDALVDAYEEALDLCAYLSQLIIERDGHLPGDA